MVDHEGVYGDHSSTDRGWNAHLLNERRHEDEEQQGRAPEPIIEVDADELKAAQEDPEVHALFQRAREQSESTMPAEVRPANLLAGIKFGHSDNHLGNN